MAVVSGGSLQPVACGCELHLIAEDETDGFALEDVGVQAKRLIRDDEHLGRAVLIGLGLRRAPPLEPRLMLLHTDKVLSMRTSSASARTWIRISRGRPTIQVDIADVPAASR